MDCKELEKLPKDQKKRKFSKVIVSLIIFMNIVFTIAVLYVFLKVGSEPMVLIGAWFAFTTGELWMLSSIKKTEVKESVEDEYRDI